MILHPSKSAMFHGWVADQHKSHLITCRRWEAGWDQSFSTPKLFEPEDLEPRRIELERNLGTDPYQIQARFLRNPLTEDVDEFGKVHAETSYFHSQMHSDYDSAESIADSDLEDGELRKMLASPLYMQSWEDCESSRMPIAPAWLAALLQRRGASAKAYSSWCRKRLDVKFVSGAECNGETCCNTLTRKRRARKPLHADPSNLERSLLEGNKDHLLSQDKTELMRQEHQVGSLNNWISELQQQGYGQRLELQDAQNGHTESRREQVRLQENYLWR